MATTIKQYFTTKNSIIALFVLVIGYIIFNEARKANWRRSLQSQIEEIDSQMGSGRLDASTLVDLSQKKKALLQEYLKAV